MGRLTVEECIRIDVRALQRLGHLLPGWSGLWSWSNGAAVFLEVEGGVLFQSQGDDVHSETGAIGLAISSKISGALVRYTAPLEWTPCNYGGRRAWFLCPRQSCGRRCAVLYRASRYFVCRRCNGLAYRTQHEPPDGRLLLKVERIHRRLGCDFAEEPTKPKWMHRKTFERLANEAAEAYFDSFAGRMARLLKGHDRPSRTAP